MLAVTTASAQEADLNIPYGYIMRQSEFKITDMYDLSRLGTNMGTARSVAMGGAFTSLGADLSSMNINPAGLGMYRTSEFGTTISLLSTWDKNTLHGLSSTNGVRTSVGMNNFGAAFNIHEGAGAVTSLTLGIGYNKLADYNYRSRMAVPGGNATILDMFDKMINVYTGEVGHNALVGNNPWDYYNEDDNAYLDEWGAVLAYKTRLIRQLGNSDEYGVAGVSYDAYISPYLNVLSEGSAGEYTVSGGWNLSNKLYMGFSLGIIRYYNLRKVTYSEDYDDNDLGGDLTANDMSYLQRIKTVGEGYNLKFGVIYRPVPEFRVGFAVHSPSFVTLRRYYNSDMNVSYLDAGIQKAWTPERTFTEKFYTPTRLLTGLSYTFGDFGILALDYEYTAYNGIRVFGEEYDDHTDDPSGGTTTYREEYKEQVKNEFRGAHAVRFGSEMRPSASLALRIGASYTMEGLAQAFMDDENIFDTPLPKSSLTLSAGLGCRLSPAASLDLTYVYSHAKYTLYDIYRYDYIDGDNALSSEAIYGVDLSRTRHNLMLSLSFRF